MAVLQALEAAEAKKASNIALLELEPGSGAFTDYFLICSGSNPRQIQAISDEVEQRLSNAGMEPTHVEGYNQAEWVLLDYVDFVVHVFSESARRFYDLERLWKSAKQVNPQDLATKTRKTASRASTASRPRATKARTLRKTGGASSASRAKRSSRATPKRHD